MKTKIKLVMTATLFAAAVIYCGAFAALGDSLGNIGDVRLKGRLGERLDAMIGEKDVPKVIAQGVLDVNDLPAEGEELAVTVPLIRPLTGKSIGALTILLRA